MMIGSTSIEDDFTVIGFAKINKKIEVDKGIILHPGIYPITGFEIHSVWLPIEGEFGEVCLSRDDFEWLKVSDHICEQDLEREKSLDCDNTKR